MKKTLLAIAFAAVSNFGAWAQTANYTFLKSTGTYTDLVSPTVLSAAGWDDDNYAIPFGFNFTIDNITNDSISFDTYGDFYLFNNNGNDTKLVIAYEADLVDRGTTTPPSQVGYQVTGVAGSRILKVEFKNVGFFGTSGPIANEFANFQAWFYEGSNKIEMIYGTSNVNTGLSTFISGTGSSHGIVTSVNSTTGDATGPFLTGAPANPTMATAVTPFDASIQFWVWPSVTGVPANGTIYSFTPAISGISKDQLATAVALFPNPATNVINFKGLADLKVSAPVTVSDVTGKVLLTETLGANQQLNISSLPKGSYIVKILTDKGQVVKHVVKQ